MIDTGYLYAKDNKRIFVNTCLGCTGGCAYCYLKKMGYDNNSVVSEVKKAEELIAEIEKIGITQDTLITLGCFSECWDDNNRYNLLYILDKYLQIFFYYLLHINILYLSFYTIPFIIKFI